MPSLADEKEAIRDLLARYCFCSDRGDVEGYAALFADDAIWDGGAIAGRWEGLPAIRGFMAKAVAGNKGEPKFRHFTANEVITITGETATVQSYLLLIVAEGTTPHPSFVGFYQDELVKKGGRWLFKSRIMQTK